MKRKLKSLSSPETLKLVALQTEPSSNLTDSLLQIQTLLEKVLPEEGAFNCAVLPEYAFGTLREWLTSKQDTDQQIKSIQTKLKQLAKTYAITIVAGSIPFQTEKQTWRNRCFIFSKSGKILGTYDKHHPFRTEKRLGLEPGTTLPVFTVNGLRMAVVICSDLWYPDLLRKLSPKIDFLAVPTMTTVLDSQHVSYGQWTWRSLVSVRSKEYSIPIVSADQASREYAPSIYTCGSSCIADPSYRFSNNEGFHTQALRITPNEHGGIVTSKIGLKAIKEYSAYRREVGLRE